MCSPSTTVGVPVVVGAALTSEAGATVVVVGAGSMAIASVGTGSLVAGVTVFDGGLVVPAESPFGSRSPLVSVGGVVSTGGVTTGGVTTGGGTTGGVTTGGVTSSAEQGPGPGATVMLSPVCPSPECDWTRRPVAEIACGWANVTVSVPVVAVTANLTPGPNPVCPPGTSPEVNFSPEGEAETTSARMPAEQNPTATLDRPWP